MKKSLRFLPLALAAAMALIGCGSTPQPEDAVAQLEKSLQYEAGELSFTIPAENGEWDILIYGRTEAEGMGMSLHYLEGEDWQPGGLYSFAPASGCTELGMDVSCTIEDETVSRTIDLLPLLP